MNCRCNCERGAHKCRGFNLWVSIFSANGGAQICSSAHEYFCWVDSELGARDIIESLASEYGLEGEYVATWRHCYGREKTHMTKFTAKPVAAPVEVSFA